MFKNKQKSLKMLENLKTTDLVKEELENDLFLLEISKEGLINYTALARKLLPTIKKRNPKATIESISIAIKRYIDTQKKNKLSEAIQKIIVNSQLSTKNDIVHMTFRRSDFMLNKVAEVSKKINWNQEDIFFVNQGSGEVTIIIDEKNKSLFKDGKKYLIEKTGDLSLISIRESFEKGLEKSINVPGIYAYFISQLSRNSINIIEIISTLSQLTFILKSNDLIRAYRILNNSVRYFRNK